MKIGFEKRVGVLGLGVVLFKLPCQCWAAEACVAMFVVYVNAINPTCASHNYQPVVKLK